MGSGNFRENLRSELNYQGMTLKELSARTGIPVSTIDCYIGTRATVPSVDAAVKIAGALQVSVEQLVMGESAQRLLDQPGREAQELIRWIKSLSPEQCKSLLKLIKTFR